MLDYFHLVVDPQQKQDGNGHVPVPANRKRSSLRLTSNNASPARIRALPYAACTGPSFLTPEPARKPPRPHTPGPESTEWCGNTRGRDRCARLPARGKGGERAAPQPRGRREPPPPTWRESRLPGGKKCCSGCAARRVVRSDDNWGQI